MLPTACEVGMGLLLPIYSAGKKKCLGRFSDLPNIAKWAIKPIVQMLVLSMLSYLSYRHHELFPAPLARVWSTSTTLGQVTSQ